MKIQDNIGKITWSFLDKFVVVIYGIITLIQMRHLDPIEFGYFASILVLVNYILTLSDSFALQGLIQFGGNKADIKKINLVSLILHLLIMIFLPIIIVIIQISISKYNGSNYLDNFIYYLPIMTLASLPRAFTLKLLVRDLRFKDFFFVNFIFFFAQSAFFFYQIYKYNNFNADKMIHFYIYSSILSSLYSIIITFNSLKFSKEGTMSWREYIKFSTPMTLTSFFHSIPKFLDLFILGITLNPQIAKIVIGTYSSAKTLFRISEQAVEASYGLLYPTTIRNLAKGNNEGIVSLFTKAVSFIFVLFLGSFLVMELGLTEIIFKYLPIKYAPAVGQFNLMLVAVLFMPFGLVSILITASGKPKLTFYIVAVSSIASLITFFITGIMQKSELIPLGIIVYYAIFGGLSFYYFKRNYGFPISRLFRAFADTKNFITNRFR
jgi:O-antigen/teichoic acid export membrane protein